MHRNIITSSIIALAASSLIGCAASSTPTRADAAQPRDEIRDRVQSRKSLSTDEVAELFSTAQGRETLQALADEFDTIFYDGGDRFVQVDQTISFYYGRRVPSLSMHNGWMHPEYAVSQMIRFDGVSLDDRFEIEFTPDKMIVSVQPNDAEPKSFDIAWAFGSTPQSGDIDVQTGKTVLRP